jgi:hypothetical protein
MSGKVSPIGKTKLSPALTGVNFAWTKSEKKKNKRRKLRTKAIKK